MNCRDYQDWLQAELDREAFAPASELADHVASCSDCRQLQAAMGRLQRGLRSQPPIPVPPDLCSRIVSSVLGERRRRQQRRRLLAGALALAACILIAIWVNAVWNRSPDDNSVARDNPPSNDAVGMVATIHELSIHAVTSLPKAPAVEPIRATVSDATSAVAGITAHTVDATVAKTKVLLPNIDGPLLSPMEDASPLEPATTSLVETGQSVSAGFEPVTNSAKRAISLFRRDLPALPGL